MPKLPIELFSTDPIPFLVTRKFPNTLLYAELGSQYQLSSEEEDILRESEEYENDLAALDEESLRALYEEEYEDAERDAAETAKKRELEAWYNQPDADADFAYWGKMPWWRIDEAIALVFGKNPESVTWPALQSESKLFPPLLVTQFGQLHEICQRAVVVGHLVDPVKPTQFLAWAENAEFELPGALVKAVKPSGKSEVVPLDNTSGEVARLTAERDELKSQLAAMRENIGARERSSLLKLVLTMAVKKYDYRPGSNQNFATGTNSGSISSDSEHLGLRIGNKTVKKYLNEATELFCGDLSLPGDP